MALTLARPAAGTKHFPSAASIQTMMMTTSTPEAAQYAVEPVSYTHLTLPTKRIV